MPVEHRLNELVEAQRPGARRAGSELRRRPQHGERRLAGGRRGVAMLVAADAGERLARHRVGEGAHRLHGGAAGVERLKEQRQARGHAEVSRAVRLHRHGAEHKLARVFRRDAEHRIVHVRLDLRHHSDEPQLLYRTARDPVEAVIDILHQHPAFLRACLERLPLAASAAGAAARQVSARRRKSRGRGRAVPGCRRRRGGRGPSRCAGSARRSRGNAGAASDRPSRRGSTPRTAAKGWRSNGRRWPRFPGSAPRASGASAAPRLPCPGCGPAGKACRRRSSGAPRR